ncbi:MAG: hypothetical protein ABIP95_15575 [Pelobium sp.]
MKTKLLSSAFLLLAIVACNQNPSKEAPKDYPINDPQLGNITTDTTSPLIGKNEKCFMASLKTDSAFLSISEDNNQIKGRLWYKFFEKDNNKGDLSGTMVGDTLKLDYTFNSEGVTSKRPLKMLIQNGTIVEVYGNEPAEKGKGFIFKRSDCRDF